MPSSTAPSGASALALWSTSIALAALSLVVYSATPWFDFVLWDDLFYLVDNPHVRDGLTIDGVTWAFTERYGANWHPVTWLAHMLDFELLGDDPGLHHASAAAWHLLCTLLLFQLLGRGAGRVWPSAAVAALFALHPLHVESVAWVAERKDLVSTAFALAAMLAHLAWVRRGGALRRLGVGAFMAVSLMAKPTYVTLPLLLLVLDLWPLRRSDWRRMALEKIPLLVLSSLAAVTTLVVQEAGGAIPAAIPLGDRLGNAAFTTAAYLQKMIWPAALSFHYPHPSFPGGTPLTTGTIALSLAGLGALTVVVFLSRRRQLIAGWLWYGIALAPTIGLVQVGTQAMADRYTYLPLVGPFWMLAFSVAEFVERSERERPWVRIAATGAVIAAIAACGVVTWLRIPAWRDSETLLRHSLPATPDNPLILNNLAWLLATHPDPDRRNPELALRLARDTIAPDGTSDVNFLDTLIVALASNGEFDTATRTARQVQAAASADGLVDLEKLMSERIDALRKRRAPRDLTYLRLARRPLDARPNIVIISIDTLGRSVLSPSPGGRPATPHIDALAAEGFTFTRALAPSSWTLPSHASLLTGTYPNVHGATAPRAVIRDAAPALVGDLQAAGYETVAFTEGGFVDGEFGLAAGFDSGSSVAESSFWSRALPTTRPSSCCFTPTGSTTTSRSTTIRSSALGYRRTSSARPSRPASSAPRRATRRRGRISRPCTGPRSRPSTRRWERSSTPSRPAAVESEPCSSSLRIMARVSNPSADESTTAVDCIATCSRFPFGSAGREWCTAPATCRCRWSTCFPHCSTTSACRSPMRPRVSRCPRCFRAAAGHPRSGRCSPPSTTTCGCRDAG
jgi:hypothetical protein